MSGNFSDLRIDISFVFLLPLRVCLVLFNSLLEVPVVRRKVEDCFFWLGFGEKKESPHQSRFLVLFALFQRLLSSVDLGSDLESFHGEDIVGEKIVEGFDIVDCRLVEDRQTCESVVDLDEMIDDEKAIVIDIFLGLLLIGIVEEILLVSIHQIVESDVDIADIVGIRRRKIRKIEQNAFVF